MTLKNEIAGNPKYLSCAVVFQGVEQRFSKVHYDLLPNKPVAYVETIARLQAASPESSKKAFFRQLITIMRAPLLCFKKNNFQVEH